MSSSAVGPSAGPRPSAPTLARWRSRFEPRRHLRPADLRASAEKVARTLLGCQIVSTLGGIRSSGLVVETEAYPGPHDPASHAAKRIGRTARNRTMFAQAGTAYVYFTYGMHWCLNVVCGEEDYPAAILIRALDPVEGLEAMRERRSGRAEIATGPGRLCQALGVTGELDGHHLFESPLLLHPGFRVPPSEIGVSGRIGIRRAADWPLRFYLRGHPEVGRPRS